MCSDFSYLSVSERARDTNGYYTDNKYTGRANINKYSEKSFINTFGNIACYFGY